MQEITTKLTSVWHAQSFQAALTPKESIVNRMESNPFKYTGRTLENSE
jgi:hypothetical protein